ncbi:MAG: hypothetical protein K8H86_10340 [Ignavibacteriaceae bacterium]|nr:hypothetical protein [Ignavibacteriaceae bacterium]
MFDKIVNQNKIKRKSFFASLGSGALGFFVAGSLPFKLFAKKEVIKKAKIKVDVNPLAVSRKKIGDKHA